MFKNLKNSGQKIFNISVSNLDEFDPNQPFLMNELSSSPTPPPPKKKKEKSKEH